MQAAIDELQALIRQHHPEAQFRVSHDPEGSEAIHLIAVLDVDDTDLFWPREAPLEQLRWFAEDVAPRVRDMVNRERGDQVR